MSITLPQAALMAVLNSTFVPNPEDFNYTVNGLDEFIRECGVGEFISGREVAQPHHLGLASALGFRWLMPPVRSWEAVGVLAIIHHNCRVLADSPIYVRNCYRNAKYNEAVGGAPASDHLCVSGAAFDCDFVSPEAKEACMPYIEDLYTKDFLDMSIGEGKAMLHIGIQSPKGRRRWSYA